MSVGDTLITTPLTKPSNGFVPWRPTHTGEVSPTQPGATCRHSPACPSAEASDREAAHTVANYPQQGWSLLCNGVLLFEDTGELLPNGEVIAPHRPTDHHPEAFGHLVC